MGMLHRYIFNIIYFIIALTLCSCNQKLNESLDYAEKNREEMMKVLDYFSNNKDPLKYESAKFLIENMPFHSSFEGKEMRKYIQAYDQIGAEPKEFRDSVWRRLVKEIYVKDFKTYPDVKKIEANFLIRAINEAVDTWRAVNWNNDYDESIFFDYVLPYRVSTEPLSDWRTFIKGEYPYLIDNSFWSSRGQQIIAAQNKYENAEIMHEPSALKGQSVLLNKSNSCVKIAIESPIASHKLIRFRYNTLSKKAKAAVSLNGKFIGYLNLEPTNTMHSFRSTRFGMQMNLKAGTNELTVKFVNDTFGLDYIEVATMEKLDESKLEDYSSNYCTIRNKKTGTYVSMDTLSASLLKPINLKKYSAKDNSLLLRLDYLGFPCWKISPKDSTNMCMEDRWVSLDLKAPVGKYNYLGANHQKWIIIPVGKGYCKIMNKDTGLFWEASKDPETGKNIIVQNLYTGKDSQKWKITRKTENPLADHFFTFGSAASKAVKVTDVMNQFEFIGNNGNLPPTLTQLCKYRTGKCSDESSFVVSLSRCLGIPTAIDFTPHWGNRTNSHAWSVLILPNGKGTPFYMGCVPGDTAQYFHSYLKPKIFRHRFRLNREIMNDFRGEQYIPSLFILPDFIDVTDEYYETTDVTREIPDEYRNHKVAYICVADKEAWTPVYYGKISWGKAKFKSMGRRILYSVGVVQDGKIVSVGNPFYITAKGEVKDIVCNVRKKQSMTLLRKYPYFGKEDFFNGRMAYGKFQGSDERLFKNPVTFFSHEGITEGCWYEHKVTNKHTYKYVRYLSPKNSYCNINELEFYNDKNVKLSGKILGTQGTDKQGKETVFDGDVLTGFNGNSPDGHWVGLELKKPSVISKVRYMPRNDGNTVENGDVYELKMYYKGKWKALFRKKAIDNQVKFCKIPSAGLYILSDITKGVEERPFIYVKGKQIWW